MNGFHLICSVNIVFACIAIVSSKNVLEAIESDPELSQFAAALKAEKLISMFVETKKVTVFAPTNAAIQQWSNLTKKDFGYANVNPHISPALLLFENLPFATQSVLASGQLFCIEKESPIPLSKDSLHIPQPKPVSEPEYYVNNAKIVSTLSQYYVESEPQYLYKIDRVLDYYPSNRLPNALELLDRTLSVPVEQKFDKFIQQVKNRGLSSLFSESGQHTFFVPIDADWTELDQFQIRAHIIPNQVLPVRVFQGNKDYPTAMSDSNIKVTISKPEPLTPPATFSGSKSETRIESHCPYSNISTHLTGTTRTGIIQGNIPVTNGIIHFIESPFTLITDSIWDILDANKHGQISKFYTLISQFPEVLSVVKSPNTLTIFAPSNEAFNAIDPARLNATLNNATLALEVAKLHLYQGTVDTRIVSKDNYTHSKALDGRDLYYSIAQPNEISKVLTIEGGGVNATAIHPDLMAKNGRVHIINKVLGIPYQSVFEKVRDDYDLYTTYLIGSRRNDLFNRHLHRGDTKFTYFAPSRDAWSKVQLTMPSEYKQLVKTNHYPLHGEHVSTYETALSLSTSLTITFKLLELLPMQRFPLVTVHQLIEGLLTHAVSIK